MPDLVLYEPLWVAELDEVRDVGVAQAVQVQDRIEAGQIASRDKRLVDAPGVQPTAPLGHPHCGVPVWVESRADLVHPLFENRHYPVHLGDQEHGPALRRSAA